MKKTFFFILVILCSNNLVFCQDNYLLLHNSKNNNEKVIDEGKRIKIICKSGKIYKGKFEIKNNDTLTINNICLNLNEIEEIRKKTALSIISGSLVTVVGAATAGFGLFYLGYLIINSGDPYAVLLFGVGGTLTVGGGAIIYGGYKLINFEKKYNSQNWKYQIEQKQTNN